MAPFKQEYKQEPSDLSTAFQSPCNDFSFGDFINYESNGTPSISPLTPRSKSISTPTPVSANLLPVTPNPLFAPPSHQYDQYRQHAGFAPGAMQNTFAVNQADQHGYSRSNSGITPSTDGYFGGTSTTGADLYDFNTVPSQPSGDIDMGFNSSVGMSTLNSSYIDPSAIGGQDAAPHAQPAQVHPPRVYPGHHQQQALAKAQVCTAQAQSTFESIPQIGMLTSIIGGSSTSGPGGFTFWTIKPKRKQWQS